jgi:magnesium transporter
LLFEEQLMQDVDDLTPPRMPEGGIGHLSFRDDGEINPEFLRAVAEAIDTSDKALLLQLVDDFHESEMGDLLEALDTDHRPRLIELLGSNFDFAALTEVDDSVREEILEELETNTVAEGVRDLESDDAVTILESLDEQDKADVLDRLPAIERVALQRSLDYPEDSAGRRMQSEFIAVPPFWTVGQTIDFMRETPDLPETFYEIFVIDPAGHLLGAVALDRLLRSKRPVTIEQLMDDEPDRVRATENQEEVARMFERYNLVSAAVVDEAGRLVGGRMVDDIVDVIGAFAASLEHMVALAVLMPIVASMGGNAGTQTMTVAVRALATRELGRSNAWRIIRREAMVGLLNGVVFAVIMGTIAGLWFQALDLGVVMGLALITVLLFAALGGIFVPLTLNRFGVDPAVSSGPFVTSITDIVGFFAFLGIATAWFGL